MRPSLCGRPLWRNGEAPRRVAAAAPETQPASVRLSSNDAAFDLANLFCNLGVLEGVEWATSVAATKASYFPSRRGFTLQANGNGFKRRDCQTPWVS